MPKWLHQLLIENVSFQFLSPIQLSRRMLSGLYHCQWKNISAKLVVSRFYVVCSLIGKASHCECEECEFKSRQNHPNASGLKHKGCASDCLSERCEFESRQSRQTFLIYTEEKLCSKITRRRTHTMKLWIFNFSLIVSAFGVNIPRTVLNRFLFAIISLLFGQEFCIPFGKFRVHALACFRQRSAAESKLKFELWTDMNSDDKNEKTERRVLLVGNLPISCSSCGCSPIQHSSENE